ncbi:MAG: hypothetical protein ACX93N_07160 [Pseudohaliea sp.]
MASAQTVANNALGDLALVPYYTVNGDWLTGIHIVNTSPRTQVVKFRFRRATDSLDALDFNIVMSPYDVYAGYLSDDENGVISWQADDTTCTVPAATGGKLTMPSIYAEGADSGYVEIIGMGSPTLDTVTSADNSVLSQAAKHVSGTPTDCAAVRSNFFADGAAGSTRGVVSNAATYQDSADDDLDGDVTYESTGDVLKVSYFIRDNASGVEFGDNAVHIQGFLANAQISNQQYGWLSGDLDGFDFPDLDGGVPTAGPAAERGRFEDLRDGTVLGVSSLINEWTANSANGAALDWVVTMPGQYTMLDLPQYVASLDDEDEDCLRGTADGEIACDNRDIPVEASIVPFNREEATLTDPEGDLVVSPAPPGEVARLTLPKETNVISFGGNSVLGVSDVDVSADLGQPYGWLALAVDSAQSYLNGATAVCDWDTAGDVDSGYSAAAGAALDMTCSSVSGSVPMIGFAAWARQVAANPDASYGRIVGHSFN